jgi:hypothetical protein
MSDVKRNVHVDIAFADFDKAMREPPPPLCTCEDFTLGEKHPRCAMVRCLVCGDWLPWRYVQGYGERK